MSTPGWLQTYYKIHTEYGGKLSLMGMDARDISVFVFLFTQKWFEKKITFSASEIFKKLSPTSNVCSPECRISYSEKSVRNSLVKLATLGFVTEHKNHQRNSTNGRPPIVVYESVKLSVAKTSITSILDDYKKSIMSAILPFESMEEAIALREGSAES